MADLIDMKSSKKSSSVMEAPCCGNTDKPEYPWGLSISLENETINKLGVNFSKLSVGQKVKLICEAEVVGLSVDENRKGDIKNVRLQITSMSKPQITNRLKAGKNLLDNMRKSKI